jgi:hypothetical protein
MSNLKVWASAVNGSSLAGQPPQALVLPRLSLTDLARLLGLPSSGQPSILTLLPPASVPVPSISPTSLPWPPQTAAPVPAAEADSPFGTSNIAAQVRSNPLVQEQEVLVRNALVREGVLKGPAIEFSLLGTPGRPNTPLSGVGSFLLGGPSLTWTIGPENAARRKASQHAAVSAALQLQQTQHRLFTEALQLRSRLAALNYKIGAAKVAEGGAKMRSDYFARLGSSRAPSITPQQVIEARLQYDQARANLNALQTDFDAALNRFAEIMNWDEMQTTQAASRIPRIRHLASSTPTASTSPFVSRFLAGQAVQPNGLSTQPSRLLPAGLPLNAGPREVAAALFQKLGSPLARVRVMRFGVMPPGSIATGTIRLSDVNYPALDTRLARVMSEPGLRPMRDTLLAGLSRFTQINPQGAPQIAAAQTAPGLLGLRGGGGYDLAQVTARVQALARTDEGLVAISNSGISVDMLNGGYVGGNSRSLVEHIDRNNIDYDALDRRLGELLRANRGHTDEAVDISRILTLRAAVRETELRGRNLSLTLKPLQLLLPGATGGWQTLLENILRVGGNYTAGRSRNEALVAVRSELHRGIAQIITTSSRRHREALQIITRLGGTGLGSTAAEQRLAAQEMGSRATAYDLVRGLTLGGSMRWTQLGGMFDSHPKLLEAATRANTFAQEHYVQPRLKLAEILGDNNPALFQALAASLDFGNGPTAFLPDLARVVRGVRPRQQATASAAPTPATTTTAARK